MPPSFECVVSEHELSRQLPFCRDPISERRCRELGGAEGAKVAGGKLGAAEDDHKHKPLEL